MKKIVALMLFLFIIASLSQEVFSLRLGARRYYYESFFEPEMEVKETYVLQSDKPVRITMTGTLADYTSLSNDFFDMNPNSGTEALYVKTTLPESIPPGKNVLEICAIEESSDTGPGGAGSRTSVCAGYAVIMPYPGKYIEAKFTSRIFSCSIGDTANPRIEVKSMGKEHISSIRAVIEVYDEDDDLIDEMTTNSIGLEPEKTGILDAFWDTEGVNAGIYSLKARVVYDGESKDISSTIRVGELRLDIIDYTRNFTINQINEFSVTVESFWNQKIEKVYSEITVINKSEFSRNFLSREESVDSWKTARLISFFDTHGFSLGSHDASIVVHYENKTARRDVTINIVEQKKPKFEFGAVIAANATLILIILVVILVLLNMFFIMVWAGKNRKKNKEKQQIKVESMEGIKKEIK